MALSRIWMPSPNYSSRGSSSVRLIVLHTAEGARTIQSLGSFFGSSSSGVSSHVGIDDTRNTIGEYVKRPNKAWTQANANPVSVSAELCAFAAWSAAEWSLHPNMLSNAAAWLAEEAAYYNLPLVRLTPQQAQSSGRGICQHVDLGAWGGGHVDCGKAFPMDAVIAMAKGTPPPEPNIMWEDTMFISEPDSKVYQLIYGGSSSYWRLIQPNLAKMIPSSAIIKDDGSWLSQWKVGSGS